MVLRCEGTVVTASPLRDGDIRRPLHLWLERQHEGCPETGIIHELRIPRPSARADIAVVNGEMVGYEIKSDVDSLARLPRQARAFNRVFDRAYIITTEKHLHQVEASVPFWWGIAVPSSGEGTSLFSLIRSAGQNPSPSLEAALFILRKPELISILVAHNLAKGMRDKRHAELVRYATSNIEQDTLKATLRKTLRGRLATAPAQMPYSS
ncbi:sce7726 family protein [Azospirillum fermentarium]|uniref:sce7726 family protein n=1 Tax=Azospirillum fermentarium TaxID=1233114 RepID=UPI003872CF9B